MGVLELVYEKKHGGAADTFLNANAMQLHKTDHLFFPAGTVS